MNILFCMLVFGVILLSVGLIWTDFSAGITKIDLFGILTFGLGGLLTVIGLFALRYRR